MGATMSYNINMVKFLIAGVKSDVGLRNYLLKNGGSNGQWKGPEKHGCTTYMKHNEVYKRLKSLPSDPTVHRQNNLGFQRLNSVIWPELDNPVIGLGQTNENHAFVRHYLDKTLGPNGNWSKEMIQESVKDFFDKRTKFNTNDFKIWTTILLHKIHFNITLTWKEGEDFMNMQKILLISIAPSESLMRNRFVQYMIGLDKALENKAKYLQRYINAIDKIFDDIPEDKKTLLASNFMDSLLFAGGQSVPTVLSYCIGLKYSSWLQKKLPNFELTNENMAQYIMEVIRFFPPVSGFVYRNAEETVYLSLHTAQCDKDAWSEDAEEFKLRDMKVYREKMVAWANPSLGGNNSRVCPGKDLSFIIIYEMLKEFIKCDWKADEKPGDVRVNGYSISSVNLDRV